MYRKLGAIHEATFQNYLIRQYENGTIEALLDGQVQPVTKPHLRAIAAKIGVDLLNSNSNTKNVRQLRANIIKTLHAVKSS